MVQACAAPGQPVVVSRGAGRVLNALVREGEDTGLGRGVSPADRESRVGGGGGQDDDQQEQGADAEGRGRQGPQAPLAEVTEVDLNKLKLLLVGTINCSLLLLSQIVLKSIE